MKKYIFLYVVHLLCSKAFAQVNIPAGAQWVNSGNGTVVINNMDLVNNGIFSAGNSSIKFTGNQNSTISGTNMPVFKMLVIAKTNNAKVLLARTISIGSSLSFISGLLDLNNNNILLDPDAYLAGETENSRITGTSGGFIEITQNLNAPLSANPGNLGAVITSAANLGTVTIRRGHTIQTGTGLTGSLQRYYSISPQNNNALNATFRFKYFDAELNGQNENILAFYQSNDNGASWINQSQSSRNSNGNFIEKTGMDNLALQTVANDVSSSVVTGLVFNAKRKKSTEAELSWSTLAETNMSGYEVQRRLSNEVNFTARAFVNSKAPAGNSSSTLSYLYIDANSYTDTSFYRLRIVDKNNNESYSDIKTVTGKGGKGGGNNNTVNSSTDSASTRAKAQSPANPVPSQKITVGPNPNNGNFWFIVNGIEKQTIARLYTIDGKALKQFSVSNLQQQQVNGLKSGIYILKVEGLPPTRIVVQTGENTINNYPLNSIPSIKN